MSNDEKPACRDCKDFVPDTINPDTGYGYCTAHNPSYVVMPGRTECMVMKENELERYPGLKKREREKERKVRK